MIKVFLEYCFLVAGLAFCLSPFIVCLLEFIRTKSVGKGVKTPVMCLLLQRKYTTKTKSYFKNQNILHQYSNITRSYSTITD